ncbi:MAG: hypothetical protein PHO02_05135 [Candidatus Nanoarchaeia archaeon]|nr:hypothetical protein [Candidatus Nanoarchaeia archaeon]
MDKLTYRILDALGSRLGNPISISRLAGDIKKKYGKGQYRNIYYKAKALEKEGIITLASSGKSMLAELNLAYARLPDTMALAELESKSSLLAKRKSLGIILPEIESAFAREFYTIDSISLISPERNARLNRMELLFILREGESRQIQNEAKAIYSLAKTIRDRYNIRIDCLIMPEKAFISFLKSPEINPLKEMLADKIAFSSPQMFWAVICAAYMRGDKAAAQEGIEPGKISDDELRYNLLRFGYSEIGWKASEQNRICIEMIIAAAMLERGARLFYAAPVLLLKNKPDMMLLAFICLKYRLLGKLLGILEALRRLGHKEYAEMEEVIKAIGVKTEQVDLSAVKRNMELYGTWQ